MLYRNTGKQVLRNGEHIADAVDTTYAEMIANALNDRLKLQPDRPTLAHRIELQSDEYACSCGMRWDKDEGFDHP